MGKSYSCNCNLAWRDILSLPFRPRIRSFNVRHVALLDFSRFYFIFFFFFLINTELQGGWTIWWYVWWSDSLVGGFVCLFVWFCSFAWRGIIEWITWEIWGIIRRTIRTKIRRIIRRENRWVIRNEIDE